MHERDYQYELILRLRDRFPGCVVLKNDAGYLQGFPDLTVLYKDRWAVLEVKTSVRARQQENQEYYIDSLNHMSFAAFIYPENEEEVLNALQLAFKPGGDSRLP